MQGRILNYLKALPIEELPNTLRQLAHSHRKAVSVALAIVVILSTGLVAVVPAVTSASETNVLANGSFEHGFVNIDGCGVVGAQWNCFTNGGAGYGFYDDEWEPVVADGHHSQLIEINTKGSAAGESDRYAGISQTARVKKNAKYTFSMRGMIRTSNTDSPDPYRYTVEVAYVNGPNANWKDVDDDHWKDVGWYTYFDREEPGYMGAFHTSLMPESDVITIFVRLRKKWFVPNEEVLLNLDAIALVGPSANMQMPSKGKGGMEPMPMPETRAIVPDQPVQSPMWPEKPGTGGACTDTDLLFNGNFETGFNDTGYGAVGRGWGPFTNGGAANYGFYDEQWEAVVSMADMSASSCNKSKKPNTNAWRGMTTKAIDMGCEWMGGNSCEQEEEDECKGHGQLIEINTKNKMPADADRYAGIFQRIGGLTPGATYTLQLRGLLRGTGDEADKYRFSAHWGINDGPDTNWNNVDHWEEMDLGPIYPRTEPGPLATYRATFRAPSSQITLFIRAQNKWAISGVELDFNLDDIKLTGCSSVSGGSGGGMGGGNSGGAGWIPEPMPVDPGMQCSYTVKAGDSLGRIASKYGTTVDAIAKANNIDNVNIIYAGQKLTIPGCSGGASEVGRQPTMQPTRPANATLPVTIPSPIMVPAERPVPDIHTVPMMPVASGEVIRAEPLVLVEPASTRTYTVQPGQSLGQIAVEQGVDARALAMANNIQNPDIVVIGTVLHIP